MVSNLKLSVSEVDLQDLFEPFNPIEINLNFDQDGEFQGSAQVILPNLPKAKNAIRTYDKVELDNKPMNLVIISTSGGTADNFKFQNKIKRRTRTKTRILFLSTTGTRENKQNQIRTIWIKNS